MGPGKIIHIVDGKQLSDSQYADYLENSAYERGFKAGQKEGLETNGAISHLDIYNVGKQEGRREVVEWIETHKKVTETELYIGRATYTHYDIQRGALEAQKKEWGL